MTGPTGTPGAISLRLISWLSRYKCRLLLLVPAFAYLGVLGLVLFGLTGVALAVLVTGLIGTFGQRIPADTWLSLFHAEPVAPTQAQGLRLAVAALSDRAGLAHEPALAIIPSLSIGAFSVGAGTRVAILMTEGLVRSLNMQELVALAAHEIGHIRNGHLEVFSIADSMMRLAQALFYLGVGLLTADVVLWFLGEPTVAIAPIALLLLAPALNSALQLALPRDMEFAADQTAAFLLGSATGVTNAGQSIEANRGSLLDDFRLPVPQRRIPLPSPLRCGAGNGARTLALQARPPSVLLPPLSVSQEPMISLLGFGPVEMRPRDRWPGIWY